MKSWLHDSGLREMEKSIRLRISDLVAKQDRLTDLLVDGNITQTDYQLRKQNADFELQRLREDLTAIEENRNAERDLDELLALATDLCSLFRAAPPAQRRALIRNCLDHITVLHGKLTADAASWLKEVHNMQENNDHMPDIELFASITRVSRPLLQAPTKQ